MSDSDVRAERSRRDAAARIIRQRSGQGELTPAGEIFGETLEAGQASRGARAQEDALVELLASIREENQDIREILDRRNVPHLYSSLFMAETYAGILLKKKEDCPGLIAEIVRDNAARYPRPTSVDFFGAAPFDLSQEQMAACLDEMAAKREYEDIERLSTSSGTLFLYSTRYLEQAHASMLAEWMEFGQFENP